MLLFDLGYQEIQGILTVILFSFIFFLLIELRNIRREINEKRPPANNSLLPLQAYERLTLFTNRNSLKSLVSRLYHPGLTVAELQAGMLESLNSEYDHNLTQQNYVLPDVWKALTNMKDQNKLIINQLASTLPPQGNAIELSKLLLQYTETPNAELAPIVLDAIQYEVKKLL